MKVTPLAIPTILLIEPTVYGDDRGFFFESFQSGAFQRGSSATRCPSSRTITRSRQKASAWSALSDQQAQGKLVRVVEGEVFDVAVDMRRSSPSFGKWVGDNPFCCKQRISSGFRRFCAWLSGSLTDAAVPLQDNGFLFARARTCGDLERSCLAISLAARWSASPVRQGCCASTRSITPRLFP
jgi:hypothetical protein